MMHNQCMQCTTREGRALHSLLSLAHALEQHQKQT